MCYVDGVETRHVVYADTKRGIVKVIVMPMQIDGSGNLLKKTLRGKVRVVKA